MYVALSEQYLGVCGVLAAMIMDVSVCNRQRGRGALGGQTTRSSATEPGSRQRGADEATEGGDLVGRHKDKAELAA